MLFGNGLYVAAINKVLRYDNIEANLDNVPAPVDMTEAFELPTTRAWRNHTGSSSRSAPKARSTYRSASPCNLCEIDRDKFTC